MTEQVRRPSDPRIHDRTGMDARPWGPVTPVSRIHEVMDARGSAADGDGGGAGDGGA